MKRNTYIDLVIKPDLEGLTMHDSVSTIYTKDPVIRWGKVKFSIVGPGVNIHLRTKNVLSCYIRRCLEE